MTECDKQVQREKIAVAIEKKKSGLVKYKRLEEIQNNLIVKQKDINTLNKELQITQEKLEKLKQQEKEYKLALNELSSCEVNYEKITRTIDNILKKKESIEYLRKIAKNQCEIYDKAKRAKEEYILTYFLGKRSDRVNADLKKYAKQKNAVVYNLRDIENINVYLADPSEFVYLFEHAELILTDSFHACVRIILYKI